MIDQTNNEVQLASVEQPGPPLPKWAYTLVNPLMAALLRSPLHRLLSNALMLLIFDGRKSGKRYIIPVGYLQRDNHLYLLSHSAWAKNFEGGAPVGLRLRGELVRGWAQVIHDSATITSIVERMVAERGTAMAQRMGMVQEAPDGTLQPRVPSGTTFIEIERR